ncbi:balbiani ring protein 3-like [Polistes fuscatus]|uniref:balbiani ring protein 3-like n=1 Tax=Polistes fuscatus TaxID=30207 RepID=UPI001CA932FA|nr:balbiani ring protein 3-like [Polistes fuscatus]
MKESFWLVAIVATILAAADLGATQQQQQITVPTECPADDPFDTTVLLAHESDCSKYYICFLGEKILKDCPYENNKGDRLHFNPLKQVCDYPADAGCLTPPKSGEKLITPAAKQITNKADSILTPLVSLLTTPRNIPSSLINSSNVIKYKPHQCEYNLYYKYIDGNEILNQCENNFHWNQELQACYKPAETECMAKGISVTQLELPYDVSCIDGEYYIHECQCDKYYLCVSGNKVLKSCEKGLYWGQRQKKCTTPEEADCPHEKPRECTEGTTKPHPCNCNLYYKCINGQNVLKQCPDGLHWSKDHQICTTPEEAKCIKICEEGSYKPHENECSKYYKCQNNGWDIQQCPNGLHWSKDRQICTTPREAKCVKICEEGSYKPHENECSQYYKCQNNGWDIQQCPVGLHWSKDRQICTTPREAKCIKICEEGSYKPHEKECSQYYKCQNNGWDVQQCPNGLHWSKDRQICTSPEDAKCIKICEEDSFKPHENDCNLYYKCRNNGWSLRQCPEGMHWSKDRQICTTPREAKCVKICEEGSYKPHENECSQYYKCQNNGWDVQQCPNGLHWSKDRQICTTPREAKCIKICEEGSYKPHENECSQYYKCQNNGWDIQQCPVGLHWSKDRQICTTPREAKCIKICEEGSYKPHENECSQYYKCQNNGWDIQQCPEGLHWSKDRQICTTPREAKCIKICEEGSYKPHEKECSQYYKCQNNGWDIQQCPNGLHWSKDRQICTSPEDAKCIKICEENSFKPHENDCNLYYKCRNNGWSLRQCPEGMHWSKDRQICTTPREAKCVKICEEGSYKPHENECSQYYKCQNNGWDVQQCPNGLHWSKDRQICTTPREAKCIKICEEGSYKPHENECSQYYKCQNNGWDIQQCPVGLHWSKDRQICTTPREAKCIKICEEGSYKPHENECSQYYKCQNNGWDIQQCPVGLHWSKDRQICTTPREAKCIKICEEGSYKPHEKECSQYYKCQNNGWDIQQCPVGLHWSKDRQICTTPREAKCIKICEEGSYKPHEKECSQYYKCQNNGWDVQQCPNGLHWSKDRQICTSPEDAKCVKICNEGEHKPDEDKCEAYYECNDNRWKLKYCPCGLHWDRVRDTCSLPENANCPRDCDEGSYKPHECECSIYYKCINYRYVRKVCKNGLHWDRTHYNCTTPEQAKCPNYHPTCVEGSYKPDDKLCDVYYKCENNQFVQKNCPAGFHWNRVSNICTDPASAKCPNAPRVCVEGSFRPHECRCDLYFECKDNQYIQRQCSDGLHWNRVSNICTNPDSAGCPNYHPKICDEGSYKPDDKLCDVYYKCENNQFVQKNCPAGFHWNRVSNVCTDPVSAKCPNAPRVCVEGSYKPDDKLCDVYYKCENNQFVQKNCSAGFHWNRVSNICTDPASAKCPNAPPVCVEGSYKPDDKLCDVYYKCENNQFVQKNCSAGFHWNRVSNICTDPASANCPNAPRICLEGSYKPHECKCDIYFECRNNQYIQRKCSDGLHWNRVTNICTNPDSAGCPNYHPKICDEGSQKSHETECDIYYECQNNTYVQLKCSSGLHWDRTHNYCTTPDKANCPNYHPKICDEGSYSPHECQCNAYYKCINNRLILQYCPSGKYWKRTTNVCTDPDDSNCRPKTTKACIETLFGAKLGKLTGLFKL